MEERKIAVLIDGENISHYDIDDIFQEIKRDGRILTARLYGTYESIKAWAKAVNEYSIQIRTQFTYTSGKNTSDSALIIDAMDILYKDQVDTFYILSSDSDFTNLIKRIKESNKLVVGVGEMKTPEAVIKACNKFIYIENLRTNVKTISNEINVEETSNIVPLQKIYLEIWNMFNTSIKESLLLSVIKSNIISLFSDFDTKNYPNQPRKFSDFLKKIPGLEVYFGEDNTSASARIIDEIAFENFVKGYNETNNVISTSKTDKKKSSKTNKNKTKKIIQKVQGVEPSLSELKEYILNKLNESDDNKLNLASLHLDIKKQYKDKDFKINNYGVSRFFDLLRLISEDFRFDKNKVHVFLKK